LTTVAEPHRGEKQLFRCRLRTAWSLPAKVAIFSMLGFELLVIGFSNMPWLWLLLLTLPIFAWFLEQEQRDLQRLISVLLDEVARQNGLIKVSLRQPEKKSSAPASEKLGATTPLP